jgi:hypothetical protein
MYSKPAAPLPIGGVLDDAIKLYRASFGRCFMMALIGAILLGAFGVYAALKLQGTAFGVAGGRSQDPVAAMRLFSNMKGSFTEIYLGIYLISMLVYMALFAHVNDVAVGVSRGQLAVLGAALRKLPGAIVASIIFAVTVTVGLVLLLIPGIYLWGKMELWLPSMFVDDVGGIEAIGRSWAATAGNWWRSVVTLSVALIIIFVLELLAGLMGGFVIGVMGIAHTADLVNITIASTVIRSVLYVAILPTVPAVMLAIYNDLKLRREGGDLAARVKSLHPA